MLQLALLHRFPLGKFNRANAFPVAARLELVERSRRQVLLQGAEYAANHINNLNSMAELGPG
jgi:fructose/tagatose bisphosphate aldolase